MKYLKTYESIKWELYCTKIKKWFRKHELDRVEFNSKKLLTFESDLRKDYIVKGVYIDDEGEMSLIDPTDEIDWKLECSYITDKTFEDILDYLNSLTPEEIEELKAKQEADKFNF